MDTRRLAMLRELSDHGLVGEVADVFGITPSAVSQQLKILENEAGVSLIEPAGRGVALTAAGRELSRLARGISVELAKMEGEWREYVQQPFGEVTMTLFTSGAEMFLPGVLTEISQDSLLRLTCADADPTNVYSVPDLALQFDIVIGDSPNQDEKWRQRELVSVPLMSEPLDVALPAGHPLASKQTLRPQDVIDETWIGSPQGFPIDRVLQQMESIAGGRANVIQRFNDNGVIEVLVAAGHGIAILPRFTTRAHSVGIVTRPLVGMKSSREILAVMRPDRLARPSVRRVVGVVKKEAKKVSARFTA